jgi:hypothetical protein
MVYSDILGVLEEADSDGRHLEEKVSQLCPPELLRVDFSHLYI